MIYEREWSNPNYDFLSYDVDNLNWHLHFHEAFEICYMLLGSMRITVNGVCFDLDEGSGVVIFPRQLHSYESVGDSKMHIITFMPSFVPEFSNRYKNMLPKSNFLPDMKKYEDYFKPNNTVAKKGLLYSILGELIERTEFKNASSSEESNLIVEVLKFVENNYMLECSLSSAAEQLSYSYTYLSRTFKKLMRMSYREYLNKYRINRAIYMLNSDENKQIQEIAAECGYESICSFNRNFKLFTGMTPSEMLKKEDGSPLSQLMPAPGEMDVFGL